MSDPIDWSDPATYLPLLGAYGGYKASGDTTQTQTTDKTPWIAAQPYLIKQLAQNDALQQYYAKNPFSADQKTAYQNQANVLANNLANVPNFNQMASNFMNSKGGRMAPMPGLLSDTKAAPIDFAGLTSGTSGALANAGLLAVKPKITAGGDAGSGGAGTGGVGGNGITGLTGGGVAQHSGANNGGAATFIPQGPQNLADRDNAGVSLDEFIALASKYKVPLATVLGYVTAGFSGAAIAAKLAGGTAKVNSGGGEYSLTGSSGNGTLNANTGSFAPVFNPNGLLYGGSVTSSPMVFDYGLGSGGTGLKIQRK